MTQELIFATSNLNKVAEIQKIVPPGFSISTMKAAGFDQEIEEPFLTLEENSRHKAVKLYETLKKNCFAEDTGLEVTYLNGQPGALSARFAGDERNDLLNIQKLLGLLSDTDNRKARFKTVITLILNGQEYQFAGICEGIIAKEMQGENGFGYDPVFVPEGTTRTFAEMTMDEKNTFSHRKKAFQKMVSFLTTLKASMSSS